MSKLAWPLKPSSITLCATREGKLTAVVPEKTSTTPPLDNFAETNGEILSWLYACPNFQATYRLAKGNTMTPTWMRAPGESPGPFAIECALDDLAYQLGIDPLEITPSATRKPATPGAAKAWRRATRGARSSSAGASATPKTA